MSWPKVKRFGRWLVPAALLAMVPKCALCLLAYAGLGAALGLGGPEICGATTVARDHPAGWSGLLAAAALGALLVRRRRLTWPAFSR